jgi:hypothetical protein
VSAAAPLAPLLEAPGPPDEGLVVPEVPAVRTPDPDPEPAPVREPEGAALEALDVPTETLLPETVTDGVLADTVGVRVEIVGVVTVGVLVLTVGTRTGVGALAVTVGVWTVTVGVLIGTVGVAIGTVGVLTVTVGTVTATVGVVRATVGALTGAVVVRGRVNEAAAETSPAIATTTASAIVKMTVLARVRRPPALITATLQHSAIRV